jgi:hypothetical protein
MARLADTAGIPVTRREWGVLAVIESRTRPSGRVVAILARGGEELRLCRVARVCGILVIRLVTAVASRGQRGVVAVDVAFCTLTRRHSMGPSQRKRRVVVIEGGIRPDDRVMA